MFWTQYLPWEIEECKCIYTLLVVRLRSNIANCKPGPAQDEDSVYYRGLPQLRNFIEDSPYTKFGFSYVLRFLDKAFYGFSILDPNDFNHFRCQHSRYAKCEHRSQYEKRRWEPSPYMIDLEVVGPTKARRTELRLIGWCFMESENSFSFVPLSYFD